jgi:two-component system, NarL family, response regulator LiaR
VGWLMRRTIFLYGLALALFVFFLKFIEYRFLVRDLSLEFYLGLIALLFTVVGIWVGLKLTRKKPALVASNPVDFIPDENKLRLLGISKREYEVLGLIAAGLSNQEIADRLFVSLNTVKTHSSNLFIKLDAKRRTQAIQKAKEFRLIP